MEIKIDPRFLESAAAGSELYSADNLILENGVYVSEQKAETTPLNETELIKMM